MRKLRTEKSYSVSGNKSRNRRTSTRILTWPLSCRTWVFSDPKRDLPPSIVPLAQLFLIIENCTIRESNSYSKHSHEIKLRVHLDPDPSKHFQKFQKLTTEYEYSRKVLFCEPFVLDLCSMFSNIELFSYFHRNAFHHFCSPKCLNWKNRSIRSSMKAPVTFLKNWKKYNTRIEFLFETFARDKITGPFGPRPFNDHLKPLYFNDYLLLLVFQRLTIEYECSRKVSFRVPSFSIFSNISLFPYFHRNAFHHFSSPKCLNWKNHSIRSSMKAPVTSCANGSFPARSSRSFRAVPLIEYFKKTMAF